MYDTTSLYRSWLLYLCLTSKDCYLYLAQDVTVTCLWLIMIVIWLMIASCVMFPHFVTCAWHDDIFYQNVTVICVLLHIHAITYIVIYCVWLIIDVYGSKSCHLCMASKNCHLCMAPKLVPMYGSRKNCNLCMAPERIVTCVWLHIEESCMNSLIRIKALVKEIS